jgi:hypothetical protein
VEVAVKYRHALGAFVVWTSLLILASSPRAQELSQPVRIGLPLDWTQHHILFSRDALIKNPALLYSEPRIVHQALQRWQSAPPHLSESGSTGAPLAEPQRDWSVALGLGRIAPNMFPAKYSFNVGAPPDCTNDYVVFGLNHVGATGGQANLVAFNNLYAGTAPPGLCPGAGPLVMFAYNITTVAQGRILNSPSLSTDGKKIAFVETSATGTSIFHVLTWSTGPGNGVIGGAAKPGLGNTASMTSLTFAAAVDTRSAPWVDYNTDTAYVGADDGNVYKFTGVFKGTPALAGAPWPVALSPNVRISTPVLDKNLGLVMVGSQNGTFYSISTDGNTVKSLVVGRSGGTNPGILAAPIVDVSNGTSFVVSANDGTSGVLVEVNSATMTKLATGRIGRASHGGTAISLFQPAFSNSYFNDPTTGQARLCGTGAGDNTPWQYAFGFTLVSGKYVMNTTPVSSQQLLTSTAARCTGWTEFFNPNVGAGGTDFFFFGLTADCTGAGTSGCVVARNANGTLTTAPITGGPTGVVVDNYSTAAQASSIYFTGAQTPNTAYKLTQNGLF